MEWRDQGALLGVRRYGETSVIIEVFTQSRGRHAGMVRGGAGRKLSPILQPGAQLDLEWRARLEEHLGHFRVESVHARAAGIMSDRTALAALNTICGLLRFALPERAPHAALYHKTTDLLDHLCEGDWLRPYLMWELNLLEDLGFGLDLNTCAVTGHTTDLAYVSPKTGRAVSRTGAGNWVDKLLPMPVLNETADRAAVLEGLRTTGYFLEHWLAPSLGDKKLPESRSRLVGLIRQSL